MSLAELILKFGQLKRIPRTGWLVRGVCKAEVESVAEHVSRTVFTAMILADQTAKMQKVNIALTLRMAVLHDLPEATLKDLDLEAWRHLSPNNKLKHRAERAVLSEFLATVPEDLRKLYQKVWRKYRKRKPVESQIVEAADKLEMAFQAYEYMVAGYPMATVREIWEEAKRMIYSNGLPVAVRIWEELEAMQQKLGSN